MASRQPASETSLPSGQLTGETDRDGQVWAPRAQVKLLRAATAEWISIVDAAHLAGCSEGTVRRAATDGEIAQRDVPRRLSSLARESVVAYGEAFAATQAVRRRRQRAPERARQDRRGA